MNWKFDFSPETSDIFAVGGGAVDLSVGRWWYPVCLDVANFAKPVARHFGRPWRRVCGRLRAKCGNVRLLTLLRYATPFTRVIDQHVFYTDKLPIYLHADLIMYTTCV